MNLSTSRAACIAAHRFGLGEASLSTAGNDPRGWLLAQIGAADAQLGDGLVSSREGIVRLAQQQRPALIAQAERAAMAAATAMEGMAPGTAPAAAAATDPLRAVIQADVRARLATAATTTRPFAERLALFWTNHFTVSVLKGSTRTLVGAFQREAIRPHIAGNFETLLGAAVTHPAMLRFLDNERSAGPNSRFVLAQARRPLGDGERGPRISGLNENLAREVLELHTLGVNGGYTQTDVTSFARVLTGWRVPVAQIVGGDERPPGRFDPAWHEPGTKLVLGKSYRDGEQALRQALHDFAQHPATARFLATKLARHFVADDPPPALVERLARAYTASGGELSAVYRELIAAPEAWSPPPAKLKTPEEFVVSSARVLGIGAQAFERAPDGGIGALGQRVHAAASPAGWPDRAEEWLGPDAVWKRVEWATRAGERIGSRADARALARESLGESLSDDTARGIERAADGKQAVALFLLSPEFQRR
jgi:uncharacterized protein (DUF1800 family)